MTEMSERSTQRLKSRSWKTAFVFFRQWPILPGFILVVFVISGVFAPVIAPHDPLKANIRDRNSGPIWDEGGTSKYILGVDQQGRDVLSRVIHGARITLIVTTAALALGGTLGVLFGMIAGYYGKWIDELILRVVDVSLAIPLVLVALVVVSTMGQNFGILVVLLSVHAWSTFTRQIRAETLQIKHADYVQLARIVGASTPRLLGRHVLPGLVSTITVIATLEVGTIILTEAILSFLGVGIPPPTAAWGSMIADGRTYVTTAWWVSFFPGIAIVLVVLGLNFTGDWLRDRFDPVLRQI